MRCPSCLALLVPKTVKTNRGLVNIDVCPRCGGIWFDKGEAEAVPNSAIAKLIKKARIFSSSINLACPICGTFLRKLRSNNLPREINASACPSCRGTFFSPNEYLKYKKFQMFKIARFQNLDIPLPFNSLLLTGIVGLLLVGSLVGGFAIKNGVDNRARAQRLIGKPFVTTLSLKSATLTFVTNKPSVSKLEIKAPFIAKASILPISNSPKKLHQITLKGLRPNTEYKYRIIIYGEGNIETKSEWASFKTP